MKKIKVALCQMVVSENKEKNLFTAHKMINEAADKGAKLVVLPEMFNCPYDNSVFSDFAEAYPGGTTVDYLSKIAKEREIYLVGGSIPEIDGLGSIYNTSYIFNTYGDIIASHRKVHLFDIDVKGKIVFKESDVLSSGDDITVFETEYGKMAAAICYDIRFPEIIRLMALKGAKIIIIPAAFNMTTGPAHWDLLFKARALDNQVFVLGCSPARNNQASYIAYGNSIITGPWGDVIGKLDEKEGILIKELDLESLDLIREQLPLLKHRRKDIYKLLGE